MIVFSTQVSGEPEPAEMETGRAPQGTPSTPKQTSSGMRPTAETQRSAQRGG